MYTIYSLFFSLHSTVHSSLARSLQHSPMKLHLLHGNPSTYFSSLIFPHFHGSFRLNPKSSTLIRANSPRISLICFRSEPSHCHFAVSSIGASKSPTESETNQSEIINGGGGGSGDGELSSEWKVEVQSPNVPSYVPAAKLSSSDQAFFLLAFIACTTSVAFTSLVIAAVPALYAMGRAAISLSKLADTAREELPSTMAAIRLSGMEISDLTLELSDLSQEIADGVSKSAQAVQAAEAGIRQIGSLARQQTMSMIQERASLPIISLQPVVTGAAKKTSRAVGQATKTFINMISRGEFSSKNEDDNIVDRLEL